MFLEDNKRNFPELEKFKLSDLEWDALKVFQDIMKVSTSSVENKFCDTYLCTMQVPPAFQQQLSHEKTPTLCNAIPAFEALRTKWEEYQDEHPEMQHVIQPGLDKLAEYQNHIELVPAYVLAMGTLQPIMCHCLISLCPPSAVNPSQKLDWYEDHILERLGDAKAIFIQAVCTSEKADPSCLTNHVTYSFKSTGKELMLLRPQIRFRWIYLVRRQQLAFWVLGSLVAGQ